MRRHTGFLYGHYDSRGGTMFVIAPDRATADAKYSKAFGEEGTNKPMCDEDYIGPATLETDDEPLTDGCDLESDGGKVFVTYNSMRDPADHWSEDENYLNVEDLREDAPAELIFVEDGTSPGEHVFHPRWDDDAFAFGIVL